MPSQIPTAVKAALSILERRHTATLNSITKRQRPFEQHNINSGPHPAVIFGCVAVTMLVVFALAVVLGRRRMKKRQQAHRNRYSALVSEGGAGATSNRNTVVHHDGYGQGTFPGYAYDGGEGGYKYTAGYAGGPGADVPPPAYTSHDSGAGSGSGSGGGGGGDNGTSSSGGGGGTTSSS